LVIPGVEEIIGAEEAGEALGQLKGRVQAERRVSPDRRFQRNRKLEIGTPSYGQPSTPRCQRAVGAQAMAPATRQ
jgi:hypothetical protein